MGSFFLCFGTRMPIAVPLIQGHSSEKAET